MPAHEWQDKTTYRKREDESPFRLLTTRREASCLFWTLTELCTLVESAPVAFLACCFPFCCCF